MLFIVGVRARRKERKKDTLVAFGPHKDTGFQKVHFYPN